MGEILDFEQRRKNFMDEYDQRANINNHIRANGTNEEVSIPEFVRTKRPLTKEEQQIAIAQKRFDKALNTLSRREQEKLLKKLREEKRIIGKEEAEREYKKRVLKKAASKKKMTFKGKATAIGLAALLTVGGVGALKSYTDYKENSRPITLEQALDTGKTPESLNIDEDTLETIQDLDTRLQRNDIDVKELIEIGADLEALQFDVVKSKIAEEAGVSQENIKVYSNIADKNEPTVETIDIEREYSKDKIPERLIPKQVEEYIATIANTQANNNNVRNGEFDKDKVIKRYQKTLETTSEFAAGNLTIEFKEQDGEKTKEVKDMEFDQITQKEYQEMQNAKNSQDKSTYEER